MTDTPKEVCEEALRAWTAAFDADFYGPREGDPVYIIAHALIARDKRAAEIVKTMPAHAANDVIAEAILRYDTPTGKEDGA